MSIGATVRLGVCVGLGFWWLVYSAMLCDPSAHEVLMDVGERNLYRWTCWPPACCVHL